MSKHQIVEAICQRNRSADAAFLSTFDEQSLQDYLTRLTRVAGVRGRKSRWIRRGDSPASFTRVPQM